MPEVVEREHATEVEGYEGNLELLAERIHRMRYDEVVKFYGYAAKELRRQAAGDRGRGRPTLAAFLEDLVCAVEEVEGKLMRIWALCERRMKK